MPVFANSEGGVVARQITYTVADITSKIIYGVMLARVATLRSQEEGYDYAHGSSPRADPDAARGSGLNYLPGLVSHPGAL